MNDPQGIDGDSGGSWRRFSSLPWAIGASVVLIGVAVLGEVGQEPSSDVKCPVTVPMAKDKLDSFPKAKMAKVRVNYGRDDLWVYLPPPSVAPIEASDGFSLKIPWWRAAEGQLRMEARPLHGTGTATAVVPGGYGSKGFQSSALVFSELGCWEVTGRLGDTVVTFVIEVSEPVQDNR